MRITHLLLPSLIALAVPAVAATSYAPTLSTQPAAGVLSDAERAGYRAAFVAIRAGDYATATTTLDSLASGPLTAIARAEMLLAKGTTADAASIGAVLALAPELPEAPELARRARLAGATGLPLLPTARDLVRLPVASKRLPTRATRADAASAALAARATSFLKVNDAASAEPLIEAAAPNLAPDALTEWRQKLAWTYLLAADDTNARRVASLARTGSGDWAMLADWVLGLSSWRAGDMEAASEAFAAVASRARDTEMMAAGLYWAARADQAGSHPERAEPRLRSAARMSETFYGLLATGLLGPGESPLADPAPALEQLLTTPNARTAAALVEIGETNLAEAVLRQQARIGSPAQHANLVALAARLNLSATQVWLCQYGPSGMTPSLAARYPMPAWSPSGGWRVDRALLLAHALQESQFRPAATSPTGARGVMQLMPATARLVAKHKGMPEAGIALDDPATSFEYGQTYLEELADRPGTGGLLPKVIAAYNAGPNNVAAWGGRPGQMNDPLFFIETMPFAETRTYTTTVLRNYWMYQRESGAAPESLIALNQGKWPRFPKVSATARVASTSVTLAATN